MTCQHFCLKTGDGCYPDSIDITDTELHYSKTAEILSWFGLLCIVNNKVGFCLSDKTNELERFNRNEFDQR